MAKKTHLQTWVLGNHPRCRHQWWQQPAPLLLLRTLIPCRHWPLPQMAAAATRSTMSSEEMDPLPPKRVESAIVGGPGITTALHLRAQELLIQQTSRLGSEWRIQFADLRLGSVIGAGSYGVVHGMCVFARSANAGGICVYLLFWFGCLAISVPSLFSASCSGLILSPRSTCYPFFTHSKPRHFIIHLSPPVLK